MIQEKGNPNFTDELNSVNIRATIETYLYYKNLILFSAFCFLMFGFVYLRYTTKEYKAEASILIKDNQQSGISDELKAIADLGIVGTGSVNNTENEIEIIRSRKIIGKVLDTLNLNIVYYSLGKIKKSELYKKTPIKFVANNEIDVEKDTIIYFNYLNSNYFQIVDEDDRLAHKAKFGEEIQSEIGKFSIEFDSAKFEKSEHDVIRIDIRNKNRTIDAFRRRVNVTPVNKNSSVVNLDIVNPVREKAQDFLNELIHQYNLDAIKDKNIVSEKTKVFIDARLANVGFELTKIQDEVKNYKDKYNITGLNKEAEIALEEVSKSNSILIELQNQIELSKYIIRKLNLTDNAYEILP